MKDLDLPMDLEEFFESLAHPDLIALLLDAKERYESQQFEKALKDKVASLLAQHATQAEVEAYLNCEPKDAKWIAESIDAFHRTSAGDRVEPYTWISGVLGALQAEQSKEIQLSTEEEEEEEMKKQLADGIFINCLS